jgi:hypothetical protein
MIDKIYIDKYIRRIRLPELIMLKYLNVESYF